jgi:HEAT repeat protein
MTGASGRQLLFWLCGFMVVMGGGCADLDLPSWVPFQGPAADQVPGVVPPAERKAELLKLSEQAAKSSAEERQRISQQLAESIKTEKDPLIRMEIIRTLGRYPGPASDAMLTAAMSDPEARVRIVACEAWGKRGDAQAVKLLSDALRGDVESDVRLAAARALGETKNQAAVATLGTALDDSDPAMQYRAVLSLKQVTGKDLGNDVTRWQQYVKGETPKTTPSVAERFFSWF